MVTNVPTLFRDSEMAETCNDMFDIIVCGGTLGIFIATALSSRGLQVGIVEKAALQGVLLHFQNFGNSNFFRKSYFV